MLGTGSVRAQTQDDVDSARAEREQVRADAAGVAARIDALSGEADQLAADLELLDVTVSVLDSRLATATRAVEATDADLAIVEEEIVVLEAQQEELEQALLESVVNHYITGHEAGQGNVLTADDPVDWSMRQGLVEFVTRDIASVQDQLRVVEAGLDERYRLAASLAADAAAEHVAVTELSAETEVAHQQQVQVLGKVSQRLDRRLAEAEALAAIDQELSEEIRRGEEEIARQVALASAKVNDHEGHTGGGSAKDVIATPDEIANVRGIEVHRSIADQLANLIAAAESAGIVLGGSGWRSTEYQIQLRRQNCGTTDYLIFDAPSEACWPPTARPASSNHEAGLAVDFTFNGRAIVDRNSVGFQWLAANAATYGFYNLWSEPWHWSVDGR